MAKCKKTKNTVVINGNNGVIHVSNGKKAKTRREKAIDKITNKQHLEPPAAEDVIRKPRDLDTTSLVHLSNNCIANHIVSSRWSQEPMIRFCRRTKTEQDGVLPGVTRYCDNIRFNDWVFRRLGLKIGMKLALFVDRRKNPRYLVIQNVVREYDAPAHLHRLGTYTLKSTVGRNVDHIHLCRPETRTELGVIGHAGYEPHPMTLFSHFPHLTDHQMRLWRLKEEPDVIVGLFRDVTKVPEVLSEKLIRENVPLLESDLRPYDPRTNRISRKYLVPSQN